MSDILGRDGDGGTSGGSYTPLEPLRPGNFYTFPAGNDASGGSLNAGYQDFHPLDIHWPCTVGQLAVFCPSYSGASNAGNLTNLYIYEDYQGWPGDILAQSTARAITATNAQTFAINFDVPEPRRVWLSAWNSGSQPIGLQYVGHYQGIYDSFAGSYAGGKVIGISKASVASAVSWRGVNPYVPNWTAGADSVHRIWARLDALA